MLLKRLVVTFPLSCICVILLVTTSTRISAHDLRAGLKANPEVTVQKYFRILNAGMQDGNFSAMKSVYASNGVLTQSNPLGETKVSRGIPQITAFYRAAYTKFKGGHWTQDSTQVLSKTVVLNYEFAGDATFKVPGRCAHIFVVKKGRIASLNWITFYSGQK